MRLFAALFCALLPALGFGQALLPSAAASAPVFAPSPWMLAVKNTLPFLPAGGPAGLPEGLVERLKNLDPLSLSGQAALAPLAESLRDRIGDAEAFGLLSEDERGARLAEHLSRQADAARDRARALAARADEPESEALLKDYGELRAKAVYLSPEDYAVYAARLESLEQRADARRYEAALRAVREAKSAPGVPAAPDLPPSGSGTLSAGQADRLRALFLDVPVMKPMTFRLLVLRDAGVENGVFASMREGGWDGLGGLLRAMYDSLDLLVNKDLPPAAPGHGERMAMAVALSRGYEAFLSKAAADPELPLRLREEAARSARLLADDLLIAEFARSRQTLTRIKSLESAVQARINDGGEGTLELPPVRVRLAPPAAAASIYKVSLKELEDRLEAKALELERRSLRAGQGAKAGLSARRSARLRREFSKFLDAVPGWIADTQVRVQRFTAHTLRSAFVRPLQYEGRRHAVIWVPDHKDLRLARSGDGWKILAAFETDIRDPEARARVKASIEAYWQGSFLYGGRTLRIATELTLKLVEPSAGFSKDSMRIADGGRSTSWARPGYIHLREGFHFGVPAHEFGHILGLPDEYTETYDAASHEAVFTKNSESLMGNSANGAVLERHLKTAFALLKRRSLEPSAPPSQKRRAPGRKA